ncbi:MAG: DUF655 domain-containing protein [Euryarchaeota archaeon HGW-Euryarchaeota-1]|nr:MAG: DUF655 domain-containing protein [Euryarchaeota archaeon HGW-Euryarchaeota-1]
MIEEKDEIGYILDFFMPTDRKSFRSKHTALVQLIGDKTFSLLECVPRIGVTFIPGEKLYIGNQKRDKIQYIAGTVFPSSMTSNARMNLPDVCEKIVADNEQKFMRFINIAPPISPQHHSLCMLHGIGNHNLKDILDERSKKPFESYDDFKARTGINIKPAIADRLRSEIEGKEVVGLFVKRGRSDTKY